MSACFKISVDSSLLKSPFPFNEVATFLSFLDNHSTSVKLIAPSLLLSFTLLISIFIGSFFSLVFSPLILNSGNCPPIIEEGT